MSRLQVIEDYKRGKVCLYSCHIHLHLVSPISYTGSCISLIYCLSAKIFPQNPVQRYLYLKMTANPFLTSSQGYNHRQGHPVSKYTKPSETAIAAAASAPLHFYNILKKHEYEPQQQWRAI